MGLSRLFERLVSGKKTSPLNANVFVVEGPVFFCKLPKERGAIHPVIQYSNMVARRSSPNEAWSIEQASWKEQTSYDSTSISGWDYKYADTVSVKTEAALKQAFKTFRNQQIGDGMQEKPLPKSTYTYGIPSHRL